MSFSITILGSSSALPTAKRFPTAQLINVNERFFLLDCGEGTQMQLRKFRIRFGKINHIFISHLHGDHVFGLFGLISSFSLLGRKNSLHIYGPPGIKNILLGHLQMFSMELVFTLDIHELAPKRHQQVFEDKSLTIFAFPLKHRITTMGYIFLEKDAELNIKKEAISKYNLSLANITKIKKGDDYQTPDGILVPNAELTKPPYKQRKYVYCTDTRPLKKIIELAKNADVLYHEATFLDRDKYLARDTGHSTTVQAATAAKEAGVGRLIIGHFSARYKDQVQHLKEAREIFSETVIAEDGVTFSIEKMRAPEVKN